MTECPVGVNSRRDQDSRAGEGGGDGRDVFVMYLFIYVMYMMYICC